MNLDIQSNLGLNEDEKVVVHRGVSAPICPFAESNYSIALQNNGVQPLTVGLYYAVIDANGELRLEFKGPTTLSLKRNVEPNGIAVDPKERIFTNWWCHVLEIEDIPLGLLGRPNRRRVSAQYTPPFPHEVSTELWRKALVRLPEKVAEYGPIHRELRYPHLARAYDQMQRPMDATAPLGSGWIFNS